jgi:hypothetical protein
MCSDVSVFSVTGFVESAETKLFQLLHATLLHGRVVDGAVRLLSLVLLNSSSCILKCNHIVILSFSTVCMVLLIIKK